LAAVRCQDEQRTLRKDIRDLSAVFTRRQTARTVRDSSRLVAMFERGATIYPQEVSVAIAGEGEGAVRQPQTLSLSPA
jgi:hypothetical protein